MVKQLHEYHTCNKSKRVNRLDNNSSVALGLNHSQLRALTSPSPLFDVHFIASGASDYDKLDSTCNKVEHIFDIPVGPQWFCSTTRSLG